MDRPRIQISQSLRLGLNHSLTTALGVLRADAVGLTRYLEEQAAQNPHLQLAEAPLRPGDWLPRWTGSLPGSRRGGADPDLAPGPAPGLVAHVLQAMTLLRLTPAEQPIALALVEALEPSGWLGRPPEAIAAEGGFALPALLSVLERLQTLDPAGLFARNLAECLRLQAREAGLLDAAMTAVLAHLPLLAEGRTARLARLTGLSEPEVLARFRLIRRLDPKPGAAFAGPGGNPPVREPDLIARPLPGGGWQVELNRVALPELRLAPRDTAAPPGARGQARALVQAVQARGQALLAVGREIAARQSRALTEGPAALTPLRMADLAEALGLAESTISRVVAGTSLDTPRGSWWLRRMFPTGRTTASGATLSTAQLRARIAALIAAEDKRKPLSDAALVARLAEDTGLTLPRRSLAHYRAEAGLPAAPARRRRG